MTPFTRLALLVGTSLYALGLFLVGVYFGFAAAVMTIGLGIGLAIVATIETTTVDAPETSPSDVEDVKRVDRTPGALVHRERVDIERDARISRDGE